jgi:glycosyltransferase involved in cell wall biosynthesis
MPGLALVHDYLLVLRGAERTFAAMSGVWPDAPIVTLLYDEAGTQGRFAGRSITTSRLQRLGVRQSNFRALLPLFPTAAGRLKLDGFDHIISSSSAFAHGLHKPAGAVHVCYCHSPFRYAWHEQSVAMAEVAPPLRPVLRLLMHRHRAFDRHAAKGVDQYVANGRITQDRIRRYWGREAPIVYPPVDVERFSIGEPGDHVLFVGELVRHKRPDLAIEAAAAAGRRIKIVGTGPELAPLKARYERDAEFLGRVDDLELARLYSEAAALVVPNVEEFGLVSVEAQAAGRPVVGIDAGGVSETVVSGRTGLLVPEGDTQALVRALRSDFTRFDPQDIAAHAQRFSREVFETRLREVVETTWERHEGARQQVPRSERSIRRLAPDRSASERPARS